MKQLEDLYQKIQLTEPPMLNETGLLVMYKIYNTDQVLMASPHETAEMLKDLGLIWHTHQDGDNTIITVRKSASCFSASTFKEFIIVYSIADRIGIGVYCAALTEQKKLHAMVKKQAQIARKDFEARSPFAYCNDIIKSFAPFYETGRRHLSGADRLCSYLNPFEAND